MSNIINNIVKNDTTYAIQDARVDDLSSVFYIEYNVTPWDTIKSHYDEGDALIVKYTVGSAVQFFELNHFINGENFVFQRINNGGSSSALNIGFDKIEVYKVGTSTTYSKDNNHVQKKLTAGDNITIENNVISATSAIPGPQGPQGEQGPEGPQGPAGADGEDGSIVTVSSTGTSTDAVSYITIDDTEYKLAGGGAGIEVTLFGGV